MTVAELITKLQELPPDYKVRLSAEDDSYSGSSAPCCCADASYAYVDADKAPIVWIVSDIDDDVPGQD